MSLAVVDRWTDADGVTYEVNVVDGFVHASQAEIALGQDVLGSIAPRDAFRLASALILAAEKAKEHRRWQLRPDRES